MFKQYKYIASTPFSKVQRLAAFNDANLCFTFCTVESVQSSGRDQKLLKVYDFILFRHLHHWTWFSTGTLYRPLHMCTQVARTCEHSDYFSIHNAQSVFQSGHGERHCSTDSSLERAFECTHACYTHTHIQIHIHTHNDDLDDGLVMFNALLFLISDSCNPTGSLFFLRSWLDGSSPGRFISFTVRSPWARSE